MCIYIHHVYCAVQPTPSARACSCNPVPDLKEKQIYVYKHTYACMFLFVKRSCVFVQEGGRYVYVLTMYMYSHTLMHVRVYVCTYTSRDFDV